jgi:hypothetical protein
LTSDRSRLLWLLPRMTVCMIRPVAITPGAMQFANQRADLNACTTFRSISARASTLCSGVTFHSRRPYAGMSRTMRSASSFEGASMINTKARSPTGTPPASIFPKAFSLITCSKWGITVPSSSAINCSGDGGSGPRAPSTRYCLAFLPGVAGADIDDRKRHQVALHSRDQARRATKP